MEVSPGGRIPPPKPELEAHFQRRVEILATRLGWAWLHIPRSKAGKRFLTQAVGPLAKGWPDLLLFRAGRVMALELKTDRGDTSVDQERVHAILAQAIEVYVIRPRDWERLTGLLA